MGTSQDAAARLCITSAYDAICLFGRLGFLQNPLVHTASIIN